MKQGARKSQTTIGSALFSVKMSGLKQNLGEPATATAVLNPYNMAAGHSTLLASETFGPNVFRLHSFFLKYFFGAKCLFLECVLHVEPHQHVHQGK